MAVQNIFKYAAKKGLRFYYKGVITVEDLFKLDLNGLDTVYKNLKKEQKSSDEESLIDDKTPADKELEIRLAIVKEIFDDKKRAMDKAKKVAESKAKNQRILEILAKKQDEALESMSEDELKAQLEIADDDDDDDYNM